VVCISPSNPTGRTLALDNLAAMSEALAGTNAFVISDEIYRDLYYTAERPVSISDTYARTLVIGGLSKSMSMTGWRIGWLCGDEEVIASALILHGYLTTCASTITQKAALEAAWTDEAMQARASMRHTFHERRDHLLALIDEQSGWRAVAPDGAFYTMLRTGAGVDSLKLAETMLAHGVITVPGAAFGSEGEGYLRVSFCAEKDVITEGVRRMAQALSR
jgi:aspartate/methionine/tyrosine aminotransferase